jgi:hypothetical protein
MQPRPRADTSIDEVVPRVRVGMVGESFIAFLSADRYRQNVFESRPGMSGWVQPPNEEM